MTRKTAAEYSAEQVSESLVDEIRAAIKRVSPYGSVEIFVQGGLVTQLTIRNIRKTLQPHETGPRHR